MIYNVLERVTPQLADYFHNNNEVKPWSYSLLNLNKYEKVKRKGFYKVNKDTQGYWILNTTKQELFEVFLEFEKLGFMFDFYGLELKITSIEYHNKTYREIPKNFNTITLHLHSSTYFYRAKIKKRLDFTEKSFLEFQLRKFCSMKIISNFSIEKILPFIKIVKSELTEKGLSFTINNKSKIDNIIGSNGYITFQISGDLEMKRNLFEIIRISEFTGIGTRTSLGFGHNSIVSIF